MPCLSIIESLDETKKYKKIKQKEEEEENSDDHDCRNRMKSIKQHSISA
jgi:hypothetical protein